MQSSVKTGVFTNKAGDTVVINYHTDTSRAYEEAGYELDADSDEKVAQMNTAAEVMTAPPALDGAEDPDKIYYKDDQDVPADPSAVAYPAGQLPRTVDPIADQADGMDPISDKTMQDSQPDGKGGTVPLVDAYDTPPTPDRNPSPEAREAQRIANAADGIVDERGVHEHQDGESTGGPIAENTDTVPMPADLQPENVVKESQGGNKNGETSQGTKRPAGSTVVRKSK